MVVLFSVWYEIKNNNENDKKNNQESNLNNDAWGAGTNNNEGGGDTSWGNKSPPISYSTPLGIKSNTSGSKM